MFSVKIAIEVKITDFFYKCIVDMSELGTLNRHINHKFNRSFFGKLNLFTSREFGYDQAIILLEIFCSQFPCMEII